MKSKNEAVVLATLIADWLNIYLPSLRSNSQHTQRSYKLALSLYACFLEREKGITFKELSKMCFSVGYIEEWLLWMKDKSAYSHDIDPHSYDVDPLEEGMAFKEQSLFACKQAVVQLYKDITFSFSWTLHRE